MVSIYVAAGLLEQLLVAGGFESAPTLITLYGLYLKLLSYDYNAKRLASRGSRSVDLITLRVQEAKNNLPVIDGRAKPHLMRRRQVTSPYYLSARVELSSPPGAIRPGTSRSIPLNSSA
jgi:hypothetical protein